MNTGEQLVLFLPALWIYTIFGSPHAAGLLGLVWLIGRALYARGYAQSFEKRQAGFGITILASLALLIAGLVSLIQTL